MARTIIRHADLDRRLDQAAEDPERFTALAHELREEFDAAGVDLEIKDPSSWRKVPSDQAGRVALHNQLRAEVEAIQPLDREREAQLARRIEFARMRVEAALEDNGLTLEDLKGGVPTITTFIKREVLDCALKPAVCRRWMEWHALRSEMVERNLYLALINVERYAHTTAGRADLIQEGSAALFRAVDGFNWRRGLLFRTYAVHWLNQAFRSYLYNFSNTVRVPVYLQKAMKHVNQAIERLGDPKASAREIASEADLAENLVASALGASRSTHSLDTPLGVEDGGIGMLDMLRVDSEDGPYSTDLEDISIEDGVELALDRLSGRERMVICKRFGIGQETENTLAEVAGELGVSLERVRQIQVRAISKMCSPTLRRAIDPFLN